MYAVSDTQSWKKLVKSTNFVLVFAQKRQEKVEIYGMFGVLDFTPEEAKAFIEKLKDEGYNEIPIP